MAIRRVQQHAGARQRRVGVRNGGARGASPLRRRRLAAAAARKRSGAAGPSSSQFSLVKGRVSLFQACSPQGLAIAAWAYASSGTEAPQLYAALSSSAVVRLHHFQPQGLANLVWGLATAGHEEPALFAAVAAEAKGRRLSPGQEQEWL